MKKNICWTLKETTGGDTLDRTLGNTDVPLNKLVSVVRYGAHAMVGKNVLLVALMKSHPSFPEFLHVHWIIHREHLAARYFKYEDVICANGKAHRWFRNFIEELEL